MYHHHSSSDVISSYHHHYSIHPVIISITSGLAASILSSKLVILSFLNSPSESSSESSSKSCRGEPGAWVTVSSFSTPAEASNIIYKRRIHARRRRWCSSNIIYKRRIHARGGGGSKNARDAYRGRMLGSAGADPSSRRREAAAPAAALGGDGEQQRSRAAVFLRAAL